MGTFNKDKPTVSMPCNNDEMFKTTCDGLFINKDYIEGIMASLPSQPPAKPPNSLDDAFSASKLADMGYALHVRSVDGTMRIYTSMDNPVAVKIYLTNEGVKADLYNIMNYSIIRTSIDSISFPHPHLRSFIKQLNGLDLLWLQNWQSMR